MSKPIVNWTLARQILADSLCSIMVRFNTQEARVMLLATGGQESRFVDRIQIGGPAHGFWQFEKGGGVKGVLTHPKTVRFAGAICSLHGIQASLNEVYDRLPHDDVLACCFARLLLYADPAPLPRLGDAQGAWDYYVRNWRPGKPHRESWDSIYEEALACSNP
jgi:hypothetical protein